MAGSLWGNRSAAATTPPSEQPTEPGAPGGGRAAATETIGRRAGSLSDELDFPEFVASLIHGTWDAMVDSAIRQMDSFGDLVAAISKPLEQFRDENVSANQARDWLTAQHPSDLTLTRGGEGFALEPRGETETDEFGGGSSPAWLADYGLAGQPLSADMIEQQLIPAARDRMARDRMQMLATLVMLGMNRIIVKDGSITARMRIRAAAADRSSVDYAVSDDPGNSAPSGRWASRGSTAYSAPVTKVSTVGVNAQTDSMLNAELFGEVKINFASETIPLERFVDEAQRVLLDRAARPALATSPPAATAPQATAPAAPQPQPAAPTPAAPANTPPQPAPGTVR